MGGVGGLFEKDLKGRDLLGSWKDEKMENGDISPDNNNTIDKNKNGAITPDLDNHPLYSHGKL